MDLFCLVLVNPSDKEVLRGGKQGDPPSSGVDGEWDWVKKIMATAASGSEAAAGSARSATTSMFASVALVHGGPHRESGVSGVHRIPHIRWHPETWRVGVGESFPH